MKRRELLVTTTTAAVVGVTGCLGNGDNPQPPSSQAIPQNYTPEQNGVTAQSRVTPSNTGYLSTTPIRETYSESWTLPVGGGYGVLDGSTRVGGLTTPGSTDGENVYFMNGDWNMSGYSLSEGEELSYTRVGIRDGVQPSVNTNSVSLGGRILTRGYEGNVIAIRKESITEDEHESYWREGTKYEVTTPITTLGPTIIAGDSNGNIHRFMLTRDLSDEWQASTNGFSEVSTRGEIRYTIAINRQNAYAVTENRIWCHQLTTGSGKWSMSLTGESTASPVLFSDSVLVPTENGVTAYNQTTGVENWDASMSDEVIGIAASPVGVVVITSGDSNQLRVLSVESGEQTHSFTIPDTATAPPTVVDDIIYIPCENGLTAFSTTTKSVTWKYPTESPLEHPVTVADGYVVFHAGGTLRCLEQPTAAGG